MTNFLITEKKQETYFVEAEDFSEAFRVFSSGNGRLIPNNSAITIESCETACDKEVYFPDSSS